MRRCFIMKRYKRTKALNKGNIQGHNRINIPKKKQQQRTRLTTQLKEINQKLLAKEGRLKRYQDGTSNKRKTRPKMMK